MRARQPVVRRIVDSEAGNRIARVVPDGSLRFRGVDYPNLAAVPDGWLALRPLPETERQWRRLLEALNRPRSVGRRRPRMRPLP